MEDVRQPEIVSSFNELEEEIRLWLEGEEGKSHHALVILGRSGTLKSSTVKDVIRRHYKVDDEAKTCYYVDAATIGQKEFYKQAFRHMHHPIVLDDVPLHGHLKPLLQQLLDNYTTHRMRQTGAADIKVRTSELSESDGAEYRSVEDYLEQHGEDDEEDPKVSLPRTFLTRSRTLIITNGLEQIDRFPALRDRAFIIEFAPGVGAVLDRLKKRFVPKLVSPEVLAWCRQHETRLPHLSVRELFQATIKQRQGKNWLKLLEDWHFDPRTEMGAYVRVVSDSRLTRGWDREEQWMQMTGKTRREFYRVQAEYREVFPTKNLPRGRHVKKPILRMAL